VRPKDIRAKKQTGFETTAPHKIEDPTMTRGSLLLSLLLCLLLVLPTPIHGWNVMNRRKLLQIALLTGTFSSFRAEATSADDNTYEQQLRFNFKAPTSDQPRIPLPTESPSNQALVEGRLQ